MPTTRELPNCRIGCSHFSGNTTRLEGAGAVEIDFLLRKLRPLIPGDVKSWKEALPFLDPDGRSALEQHVRARAADLLGDWERKVLLPPPPRAKALGPLPLGNVVYEGLEYPFGLSAAELLQGLGLYGRSGAGKTTAVFALLRQLARRRIHFLFIPPHLLPLLRNERNRSFFRLSSP